MIGKRDSLLYPDGAVADPRGIPSPNRELRNLAAPARWLRSDLVLSAKLPTRLETAGEVRRPHLEGGSVCVPRRLGVKGEALRGRFGVCARPWHAHDTDQAQGKWRTWRGE